MPNTELTGFEEIAHDTRGHRTHVRAQVAFIRSLMDEIVRNPTPDPRVSALGEQLYEEMARLRRMVSEP